MKTFILLILSCTTIFGAETGIQITSICKTNSAGRTFTMDIFTRDGQTNLVRTAVMRKGKIESQIQKFYHDGLLAGEYWSAPDSSGFFTVADSPYSLIGKYWPRKAVSQAFICTKDRVVLDYFDATNGIFYPASSEAVQDAHKMTANMRKEIQNFPK